MDTRRPRNTLGMIAAAAALAWPPGASAQLGQRLLRQLAAPKAQNATVGQYAFYEGELHFEKVADPACAVLTNGFYKVYFAAHSNPEGGIEAYMFGEKIMHAHITGSDRNHLDVNLLGENATSRSLHLVALGKAFVGTLQSKTLVSELFGSCPASNGEFKVSLTNANGQEMFQRYQQEFNRDLASEEDLVLARRGHIQEALPRLRQAFADKTRTYSANHPQMLRYYYSLALAYEEAGLFPYSAYWYQKSADVCRQAFGADNACIPITMWKLGLSLEGNGKPSEAEAQLRQAEASADKVFGQKATVVWRSRNALARVLISMGRYREASEILQQAITLAKLDTNADANIASVNLTYAALYGETGRYQLAEDTLRQSIDTLRKIAGHETPITIGSTVALANILRRSGQSIVAEPLAKGALDAQLTAFGPERPDHPIVSATRVSLARIYMDQGKTSDAETLLQQSLDGDKKYLGPDHPAVAVDELSLAAVLRAGNRETVALPLIQDAYRISRMTPLQGLRWRAPAEFMQLYAGGKVANPALAIYYGKEAVNALQDLRGGVQGAAGAGGDGADGFIGSPEVKNVYDTLADLLLTDKRLGEAQQVLALVSETEMAQFSERSVLVDAEPGPAAPATPAAVPAAAGGRTDDTTRGLRRTSGKLTLNAAEKTLDDSRGDEIKVAEEYETLRQQKSEQGDEFSSADQARLEELRRKMDGISASSSAMRDRVLKSAKTAADKKLAGQEFDAYSTEMQSTLKDLGNGTVAATYFVTAHDIDIVFTTPSVSFPRKNPIESAKLDSLIRKFRAGLSSKAYDPAISKQLYSLLIDPIAEDLKKAGAKTLMLSLHGSLRYVPFAALQDQNQFLVESLALVNVNDAARSQLATPRKATDWTVWGLGVSKAGVLKSGYEYDALSGSAQELADIKQTLGGKSKISLDRDFTESRLEDGLGGSYPVIHIASHFLFTPHSSDESFLVLGDGSSLSLSQLRTKINFNGVELLTLSACQTAVGDDRAGADGSEVEALGNIAQAKGAKAVVASLWPVADESTAALMSAFYKGHQDHLDKAEALRRAQLALLHGEAGKQAKYADPFYWAPFILMGNWL